MSTILGRRRLQAGALTVATSLSLVQAAAARSGGHTSHFAAGGSSAPATGPYYGSGYYYVNGHRYYRTRYYGNGYHHGISLGEIVIALLFVGAFVGLVVWLVKRAQRGAGAGFTVASGARNSRGVTAEV